MKTIVLAAFALAVAVGGCSASVDQASRRDLPEAPLAPGVARVPWSDPNKAPADEVMVVLSWDDSQRRLARVITAAPLYAQAYYDDDEVRRICQDKLRMKSGAGRPTISVYASRGVLPSQAIHVANALAASKSVDVRLLVRE